MIITGVMRRSIWLLLVALIPFAAIAGRHAGYLVRQLYFLQNGSRSGPDVALMHNVAERLSDDDIIAIAAYLASLQP